MIILDWYRDLNKEEIATAYTKCFHKEFYWAGSGIHRNLDVYVKYLKKIQPYTELIYRRNGNIKLNTNNKKFVVNK